MGNFWYFNKNSRIKENGIYFIKLVWVWIVVCKFVLLLFFKEICLVLWILIMWKLSWIYKIVKIVVKVEIIIIYFIYYLKLDV